MGDEVPAARVHVYLSTGCLHGFHDYCCSSARDDGGVKVPHCCRFCQAPCVCECHLPPAGDGW